MPSEMRKRAYEHVAANPGAAIADVAERLGVDHSTATYHLHRLERRGAVVARPAGRSRAYFVNGCGVCPYLQWALPRLRARGVRPALNALRDASRDSGDGRVTVAGLTRRGVPPGRARWALRRLEDVGLVDTCGRGAHALRPGREECAARALDRAPCPRWGECAVSKEWRHPPGRREAVALAR